MPTESEYESFISELQKVIVNLSDSLQGAEQQRNTLLDKLKMSEAEVAQLQSLLLSQAVQQSKVNWVQIESCWFAVGSIRSLYQEGDRVMIDGIPVGYKSDYARIAAQVAQLKRRVRPKESPSAGSKSKASRKGSPPQDP